MWSGVCMRCMFDICGVSVCICPWGVWCLCVLSGIVSVMCLWDVCAGIFVVWSVRMCSCDLYLCYLCVGCIYVLCASYVCCIWHV